MYSKPNKEMKDKRETMHNSHLLLLGPEQNKRVIIVEGTKIRTLL